MVERIARFWDIWCVITGCEMNVAKLKKTVFSGIEWNIDQHGEAVAADTLHSLYIRGAKPGDPRRRVSQLSIMEWYKYVGFKTRLAGDCVSELLTFVAGKIKGGHAAAAPFRSSRRIVVETANAGTLGNCFFYGAVLGATLERIDSTLGVAARAVMQSGAMATKRVHASTPSHTFATPLILH